MQTRHWTFTLNNWTSQHDDALRDLGTRVTYLVYGYEGREGEATPHLQGYIIFPRVKRFREALAQLPDGCHIEAKRGTSLQAADYCKKEGVYHEVGERPLPSGSGGQFAVFVEWIVQYQDDNGHPPNDREIAQQYPALFVRYGRRLRELAEHHAPRPVLEGGELRDWQRRLVDELLLEPDDRTIKFIVDPEGGKGKSWLQRYLLSLHPDRVQVMSVGKRDDLAHAVDESKDIFLFNIPRNGMEFFNYTTIEQIKDRMVFSPKYDSRMKVLRRTPHVVVFSNEHPDGGAMTPDRYLIEEL